MKAYGVFDGGGVKGAALAGCLGAAQERGIDFQGYAGSSAGAIVALLASIGYTGDELRSILLSDLKPVATLGDGGVRLGNLKACAGLLGHAFSGERGWLNGVRVGITALWKHRDVIGLLDAGAGIYESKALGSTLRELVLRKFPELVGAQSFTFQELRDVGASDLKILAADLSSARAAIFSRNDLS